MVVEKQQILYGSDVAAPTISKRLQTENGNSLAIADAIKPLIFGDFRVFRFFAVPQGKPPRSVSGSNSPSPRVGFSAPNKLSLLYARIDFAQCLQGFDAVLALRDPLCGAYSVRFILENRVYPCTH